MQDFYSFIDSLAKSAIAVLALLAYLQSRRNTQLAKSLKTELDNNPAKSADEVVKKLNGNSKLPPGPWMSE